MSRRQEMIERLEELRDRLEEVRGNDPLEVEGMITRASSDLQGALGMMSYSLYGDGRKDSRLTAAQKKHYGERYDAVQKALHALGISTRSNRLPMRRGF